MVFTASYRPPPPDDHARTYVAIEPERRLSRENGRNDRGTPVLLDVLDDYVRSAKWAEFPLPEYRSNPSCAAEATFIRRAPSFRMPKERPTTQMFV